MQQLVHCKFTPKFHSNFSMQKSHILRVKLQTLNLKLRTPFIAFSNRPGQKQPGLKIFPFHMVIKKTPKHKQETQPSFKNYTKQGDIRTAKGQAASALPGCQRIIFKSVNICLDHVVQFSKYNYRVPRAVSDLLSTF